MIDFDLIHQSTSLVDVEKKSYWIIELFFVFLLKLSYYKLQKLQNFLLFYGKLVINIV